MVVLPAAEGTSPVTVPATVTCPPVATRNTIPFIRGLPS
jgi:hypothetical protein